MNHFFCEFPEKAKDRIKKIYQLYNRNPSESVRLVDKTVSSCKKCLEVYLNCSPEWWFEKKRVCTNFCPEKLYHWELLSDEDIFYEYKACMGCRTAYFGFKSIVFLIKDKTRSNESWSKVQLESVELTSKEIKFLLDGRLKKDVCFFKALNLLFSKVPASYRDQIKSILFETYKNDKEMSKDITDLRIEALNCLGQFIEKYTIEPTEVGMVYEDLLGSKRIDLLIKHYSVFENLNFNISEIFQKTSTFDLTTFSFIVSHIEKIDITYSILNGVLKYMLKSYQTKCAFDTRNIDLLFHKIVMFLVKNSEYRTNGLINKLALANFAQFKDGAYWLLYLNLLFSIPITKVSLSHPKGLLLFQLTDKKIRELVLADPNAVSEFISEINEFKPFVDSFESIGIEISKRLKFDFSTAVQFTNTFGNNQAMLDNIIENLTFQSPNIDILSESARFSCSEFLSLLKQRMKLNNTGRGDPDSIMHIHAGLSGNPSGNARLLTTVPDSKACFDELKSSIEVDDINIRDAQVRSKKRIPKNHNKTKHAQ
ncbi:uncharacterized protein VICG_00075 [Vittaforma corneae ATCC 50505]|uniref:Uncharacterized protein n=1 Tax=Vittaforma corneae (strain ATCC 50505) TaxID=993615 RepID=L2GQH3_VITCO|nr:uncharacterized protein VICG_00075 [Vittaforma corneae ATCC 50505]ELA42760.1 hypothetical protein VICG_00075 [Vittaforma corneae ATCC 50505]